MLRRITIILLILNLNIYAYEQTTDSKNSYYESEHFRTISGISYSNSASVKNFSDTLLDAAETSWEKEVVTLGFKQPRHSDTQKIDIYIGNKSAYNYETESFENIGDTYAGWATSYPSNNAPYFLINPKLSSSEVDVTIAHEFFHTIQYAYFDERQITDSKWITNIWWLEATAVMMEDEVYSDNNDYVGFLEPFFNASYKSFETYDGSHEYSMVILAKFIKQKYGMQIFKDAFSSIETSGEDGYYEILSGLLRDDYNTTISSALSEFALWVSDPASYFEDGELYPTLKHFASNDTHVIKKGGIEVVDNITPSWSMLSIGNAKLASLNMDDIDIVWSYQDGIWKNTQEEQIDDTNASTGYWVKANKNSSLIYTYYDVSTNDTSKVQSGWSLLSTTTLLKTDDLTTQPFIIWHYTDGAWSVFSNDTTMEARIRELEYPALETILPYSSYWIKKL